MASKFGIKATSSSEVSDERALAKLEFQKMLETSNVCMEYLWESFDSRLSGFLYVHLLILKLTNSILKLFI